MAKSDKKKNKSKTAKDKKLKKKGKASGSGPAVSSLAPARFPDLPLISGVRFATGAVGVKYQDRTDVMLAEVAAGATLAGVFTRSATRSAAVLDCQAKLAALPKRAEQGFGIVVNSGNANTFTGKRGESDVAAISEAASAALGVPVGHIFTASTGVIGEPLPAERITDALPGLADALAADGAEAAARAIMTTDTFAKGASAQVEIDGVPVTIMGFAKGSGMIAPDMATMLGYVFTDAAVEADALQSMLSAATKRSFNAVTVDSDTSTSDTVLLAATGAAGNAPIAKTDNPSAQVFAEALLEVMHDLALQIVRDGEGATKLVEVKVTGAESESDAEKVCTLHRQLTPGEDRDCRGRPKLGPDRDGRGQIRGGGGPGSSDHPVWRCVGCRERVGC